MRYIFNPTESGVLRYVHPLKREKMRLVLESDIPSHVNKIYLFGSSLDLSCRTESDVDLYFITTKDPLDVTDELHKLCRITRDSFDILVATNDEFIDAQASINTVEHKIASEGLLVYEKEEN